MVKNNKIVKRPLGAKNSSGNIFSNLRVREKIRRATHLTKQIITTIERAIKKDFKSNKSLIFIDQPNKIKKNVLTTKADSSVTTLKSSIISSIFWSPTIKLERKPFQLKL